MGLKCEVAKAKFWESLTFMFFFTAMLITYIKGGTPAQIFFGEGVCNVEGYICYFLTDIIKLWNYISTNDIWKHNNEYLLLNFKPI
jgi:hypothetical protein